MASTIELRQKRRSIVESMRGWVDRAEAENRGLDALEREQWDRADAEVNDLTARIDRLESIATREADASRYAPPASQAPEIAARPTGDAIAQRNEAFWQYVRRGGSGLTAEQRSILAPTYRTIDDVEARAQSVGTDSAGGYAVPDLFQTNVETNMLAYSNMLTAVTRVPSASGATLLIPTSDDTSNKGAILAENTAASEQDITFGQTSIDVYVYSSKLIRVSYQLLNDASFPLESWLQERLAERMGRIINEHFTTGDGSSKPYGIVTGASLGKTGAAGQTSTIIYDDLVDLEHSIDPSYRGRGRFMMNDATLKVLKKLKDSQSRPLWVPGMATSEPSTILGYQYIINQDMATPAASAKTILFGDFGQYYWRSVTGTTVQRLSERYADYLQVAFHSWQRHGGRLINAGTNPVKYYQHPAS